MGLGLGTSVWWAQSHGMEQELNQHDMGDMRCSVIWGPCSGADMSLGSGEGQAAADPQVQGPNLAAHMCVLPSLRV